MFFHLPRRFDQLLVASTTTFASFAIRLTHFDSPLFTSGMILLESGKVEDNDTRFPEWGHDSSDFSVYHVNVYRLLGP